MDKPTAAAGAAQKIEKQARQLAYDTRYKVKQAMKATSGSRLDPAAVRKAYVSQLSKSSAAPAIKARAKQMLLGEEYITDTKDFASNSVANALYKVFVEGIQKEEEPIVLTYMEKLETAETRKYKVRVTDKKTNNSYVRYATREKISELRSNPNIASVEMTGHGEPTESEKKRGGQTAKAKGGGLDPVGREDKDIDNDGDHDKTDKYLLNRRKVRGAAIAKKGKVSEEFLGEVNDEKDNPDANAKKIDVMKGKNKVTISPEVPGSSKNSLSRFQVSHHEMEGPFIVEKAVSQAQQKFMGMVYAAKKGAKPASPEVAKAAAGMSKKEAKKFAKTKHEGLPVHKEEMDKEPKLKKSEGGVEDPREIPTKLNLAKNKLRAMGIKCSYEPEGEVIDERRKEDKVAETPRKPRNPAFELVAKSMGTGRMGVKPRGVKKEKGAPTPGPSITPAQKVAKRRAAAQRAQDNMSSRFD